MPVVIDCPTENGNANVERVGTGLIGFISASGTADTDTPDISFAKPSTRGPLTDDVYERVCALVYPGFKDATSADVPDTHPRAAECINNPGSGATNVWYFPRIPGAVCSAAPGTLCTLVIWAKFPNVMAEQRAFGHFKGICADNTSCPPPAGTPPAPPAGPGSPVLALTTVPQVWQVAAERFSGPDGAAFAGRHSLHLRGTENNVCSWDNGGDGTDRVRIVLSCESPIASTWRLVFRLGKESLAYQASAASWNLTGSNSLVLDPGVARSRGSLPPSLEVIPG